MVNAPIPHRLAAPIENPIFALSASLEEDGAPTLHISKVDSNGIYFKQHPARLNSKSKSSNDDGADCKDSSSAFGSFTAPFRRARQVISRVSDDAQEENVLIVASEQDKVVASKQSASNGTAGGERPELANGNSHEAVIFSQTPSKRSLEADLGPGASIALEGTAERANGNPGASSPRREDALSLSPISTSVPLAASSQSPDRYLAPPSPRSRSPPTVTTSMRRANTMGSGATFNTPPSPTITANRPGAGPRLRSPQRTMSHGPHLVSQENPEAQFQDSVAKQADAIRRERAEKRLEKEKNDEREARERAKSASPRAATPLADRALKGNIIGEDHVNYVLMYNMLTGIRIGVSRCQAKVERQLQEGDYSAKHKFSFDIIGNELTPSARYDFKFKDYAPWVFRDLREHFYLDPADYLVSLTAKYILSEFGSPGKSGSFFYFSRDYRFIIKTIARSEHKFLLSILPAYHAHVKSNPQTLLSRFYGLHRVKLPRGRKIHFVIMNNLFPPHRDVHETFDLKGSTQGRECPEEKARENPSAVLKDLNWLRRHRIFELGPQKKAFFEEQLRRDADLLQKLKIMDYSLLVGIHDMNRGNKDNLREHGLSTFQPEPGKLKRRTTQQRKEEDAMALRQAVQRSDPQALSDTNRLPDRDRSERKHFLFYQDEGGMRATADDNEPLPQIYYLGIIDILTPYTLYKRFEHFGKSFKYDGNIISAVPPRQYASRFLQFIFASIRGVDPPGKAKEGSSYNHSSFFAHRLYRPSDEYSVQF